MCGSLPAPLLATGPAVTPPPSYLSRLTPPGPCIKIVNVYALCACVHLDVCVCVCVCVYVRVFLCAYVCMGVCMHVFMFVRVFVACVYDF